MRKFYSKLKAAALCLCLILSLSTAFGQNSATKTIDMKKAAGMIDSLGRQFSQYFLNGDSVALYKMYAKDAMFETLKGDQILAAWGKEIRSSIKDDARNLLFTTTSLSTDGEFLVELGIYEIKDGKGNSKDKGKYLVVWKQEDGNWKLYRDMGL